MAKRGSKFCKEVNLRVLVDMDMVLCDFEGQFLHNYKARYPDEPFIPLEERSGFYVRDQYEKIREDLPEKVRSIYNAEGFILSLPEIPGAVEAVKEMSQIEGVDVFICTSPLVVYDFCVREKFQWIEDHLGAEWLDRLVLTKDKTMVYGHVLIDDRPNIKGAVWKPSWEHVVFSACHNLRTDIRGKTRLDNWTDGTWRKLIEDFKKRI